eukprot:10282535-Lingulodinium_polyedra.AAC.1
MVEQLRGRRPRVRDVVVPLPQRRDRSDHVRARSSGCARALRGDGGHGRYATRRHSNEHRRFVPGSLA